MKLNPNKIRNTINTENSKIGVTIKDLLEAGTATIELILALLNFTTINACNACFFTRFYNDQCSVHVFFIRLLLPIDHSIDNGKQKNDHLNLK